MDVSELDEFLPNKPIRCVYFLMVGKVVVYVGITDDLEIRIRRHRETKQFETVRFLRADNMTDEELEKLEQSLIKSLNPVLNVVHTSRQPEKARATMNMIMARLIASAPRDCETMSLPVSFRIKLGLCEAGLTNCEAILAARDDELANVRFLARTAKSLAKMRAIARNYTQIQPALN
jgi:hypothetical protein